MRRSNAAGSAVGGGDRGRKPLGRETVKGERADSSLGLVGMVVRTGKVGGGVIGPISLRSKGVGSKKL